MNGTTSDKVINELRTIFAYFGLPRAIVSDNGPPFNAKEFVKFCQNNNIECLKSPPYHPQSNGWAECGVRTVKQSLKKMVLESSNKVEWSLLLARLLIKYRNTPVSTTGITPNDRSFCFRPTILMDALTCKMKARKTETNGQAETTSTHNASKQHGHNKIYTGASMTYSLNEIVLYRNEFKKETKWLKANQQISLQN